MFWYGCVHAFLHTKGLQPFCPLIKQQLRHITGQIKRWCGSYKLVTSILDSSHSSRCHALKFVPRLHMQRRMQTGGAIGQLEIKRIVAPEIIRCSLTVHVSITSQCKSG